MYRRLLMTGIAALLLEACGPNLTALPDDSQIPTDDDGSFTCLPNLDGRIEAHEMPAVLDRSVSFFVSPSGQSVPVDVEGAVGDSGIRQWDWSTDSETDRVVDRTAHDLQGRWFETTFPTAEFTLPLDADGTIDAVYSKDSNALWLHGLASREEADGTLLPYDEPVALLRFPLEPGRSWTSVGRVSAGTFTGFAYAGTDMYEMSVDALGHLDLPEILFTQVHRLRARTTVQPDVGTAIVTYQTQFLFECFGEVGRATSSVGETSENFTTAAEMRRYKL